MAFTFNGAQANVVLSGGVAFGTPSSTQITQQYSGTGTASVQTAGTVPAGKRFLLYGYSLQSLSAQISVYQTDGTTKVGYQQTSATTTQPFSNGGVPIQTYDAGEFIKVYVTNAKLYLLWGILENV